MNILITGVTGFVGTNLVKYYSALSDVKLFGTSRQKDLKGFTLLEEVTASKLDEYKIEALIHLAGIAHDLRGQYKPEDYYHVNYEGTKRVVNEFMASGARKFIYVSSIKAVSDVADIPVDESIIPSPVTDYGKSKLLAEQYIQSELWPRDKHYYIFRPCMIHGPGNKGNLNLLYRFARLGIPYPFGDFHNQRSMLCIDNFNHITHTFIKREIPSGIYHLADEGFISTSELYALITETIGGKPIVLNMPRGFMRILFSLLGKRAMLIKLTEDMMVENKKVLSCLDTPLPVSMREGLVKTIRSFESGVVR